MSVQAAGARLSQAKSLAEAAVGKSISVVDVHLSTLENLSHQ
jgi:hypothetical protein